MPIGWAFMLRQGILFSALFFAGGLGLGYWLGQSPPGAVLSTVRPGDKGRQPSWEDLQASFRQLRGLFESGDGRRQQHSGGAEQDSWGQGDNHRDHGRSRAESFLALKAALSSGDSREVHSALHDLQRGKGELSLEQVQELGELLGTADRDLVHVLARALVMAGGKEGVAVVLGLAEDPSQSLERRRQAIEALASLPPERAGDVVPALAEFLSKGPPTDLERTAASAIGRLAGEAGVETLLGLLNTHPGIRAEAVFDAVGDVGGPSNAKSMLALLGGDWSAEEKMSLLRSSARLVARGDDPSALLGLLREPPAGMSRETVARALGDASHDLGTEFLGAALVEAAGDRRAQEALARALIWQGGKEGLESLLEAAANPEAKLDQKVLARALNEFRGEAAVPLMLDLFRSSRDEEVLEPLARSLARNAGKEAMESLLGLLEPGGNAWQRRALARALEDSGSVSLGPDRLLELLHGEKDQEVASSLARALTRFHPAAVADQAAELFQNATSPVERIAFAHLLEKSSTPGMAAMIGQQLQAETDSKAQWEMARILGKIGGDGIEQITSALRNAADERQRHSLLWGLEASRRPVAPEARSLFVEMASSDPSPSIRAQAAEILGRQQDPALIATLNAFLAAEPNRDVRERIERALRELDGRR